MQRVTYQSDGVKPVKWGRSPIRTPCYCFGGAKTGSGSDPRSQVSFDILMDGNLDEKSLFLAAIDKATWRATER